MYCIFDSSVFSFREIAKNPTSESGNTFSMPLCNGNPARRIVMRTGIVSQSK